MNSLADKTRTVARKTDQKSFEEDLIEFFRMNPNPTDDQVHLWARSENRDVEKVEEAIYGLATRFVNILTGGKYPGKVKEDDFDPKQIKKGIKVELEHTPDKDVAKKIVLDHLVESPTYYDALEKMEAEFDDD